jgi:hypothetical protein
MAKAKRTTGAKDGERPPWADQAIPVAGVPSGVHAVRDDNSKLCEVVVSFWARFEVRHVKEPSGIEALHLIALSTVDYLNALVHLLNTEPVEYANQHANALLCAIASLGDAAFAMDRSPFAAAGPAPRGASGRLALSAHQAVLHTLTDCVTWALHALEPWQRHAEPPLGFFNMLASTESDVDVGKVVSRLQAAIGDFKLSDNLADWSNARVLLQKEMATLRKAIQPPFDPIKKAVAAKLLNMRHDTFSRLQRDFKDGKLPAWARSHSGRFSSLLAENSLGQLDRRKIEELAKWKRQALQSRGR